MDSELLFVGSVYKVNIKIQINAGDSETPLVDDELARRRSLLPRLREGSKIMQTKKVCVVPFSEINVKHRLTLWTVKLNWWMLE